MSELLEQRVAGAGGEGAAGQEQDRQAADGGEGGAGDEAAGARAIDAVTACADRRSRWRVRPTAARTCRTPRRGHHAYGCSTAAHAPCSADRAIASSTAALCTASRRVAPYGVSSATERRKRYASTTFRSS
ncbi:hypothetical protein SUDANB6_00544 [Streptomyces sp. enrichment culture]